MYEIVVITSWSAGSVLLILLMSLFLKIRFMLFNKPDVKVGTILVDTFILYSLWCILTIGTISLLLASNQYVSRFVHDNTWFTPAVGIGWVLIPTLGIFRLLRWSFDR